MMTLAEYIAANAHETRLTLVGPLVESGYIFSEPVVFVDGGTNCRIQNEGYAAGDGDSSSQLMDEQLNPEKDFSDLAHVLNAIENHFDSLTLHGFLGGRKDHELINLAEVQALLKRRTRELKVEFDSEIVAVSQGEWTFEIHGTFSIFLFEPGNVNLSGDCKYKIDKHNPIAALSSFGLSNEANGLINVRCSQPLFIFLNNAS